MPQAGGQLRLATAKTRVARLFNDARLHTLIALYRTVVNLLLAPLSHDSANKIRASSTCRRPSTLDEGPDDFVYLFNRDVNDKVLINGASGGVGIFAVQTSSTFFTKILH